MAESQNYYTFVHEVSNLILKTS